MPTEKTQVSRKAMYPILIVSPIVLQQYKDLIEHHNPPKPFRVGFELKIKFVVFCQNHLPKVPQTPRTPMAWRSSRKKFHDQQLESSKNNGL